MLSKCRQVSEKAKKAAESGLLVLPVMSTYLGIVAMLSDFSKLRSTPLVVHYIPLQINNLLVITKEVRSLAF